jgi:hypothetical protein
MEEGMLLRAGVMEGPCAVARGKDIDTDVKCCFTVRCINQWPSFKFDPSYA